MTLFQLFAFTLNSLLHVGLQLSHDNEHNKHRLKKPVSPKKAQPGWFYWVMGSIDFM